MYQSLHRECSEHVASPQRSTSGHGGYQPPRLSGANGEFNGPVAIPKGLSSGSPQLVHCVGIA